MSSHPLQFLKPFSVSFSKFASSGAICWLRQAFSSVSSAVSQRPEPPPRLSVGSSPSGKSLIRRKRTVLEDAVLGAGSEGEDSVDVENIT